MPRKKKAVSTAASEVIATTKPTAGQTVESNTVAAAVAEPEIHAASRPVTRPEWIDGPSVDSSHATSQVEVASQLDAQSQPVQSADGAEQHGKNWGEPYKSIFNCPEMGFELGENRRFKKRVFRFDEKPTTEILMELKDLGFVYRAAEKAWTINATPGSRKLTDDLARKWAGPGYIRGIER